MAVTGDEHSIVIVPLALLSDEPALEAFLGGRTISWFEPLVWAENWAGPGRGDLVPTLVGRAAGVEASVSAVALRLLGPPAVPDLSPAGGTHDPHHRGGAAEEATHE